MASTRPRSGTSIVELLVALALAGAATALATSTLLTAERLERVARAGGATDLARRDSVSRAAAASDCRHAASPEARQVTLPSSGHRPLLQVSVRCGR